MFEQTEHASPMLSEVGFLKFAKQQSVGKQLFGGLSDRQLADRKYLENMVHTTFDSYISSLDTGSMVSHVNQHIGAAAFDLRADLMPNVPVATNVPPATDTLTWVNPDYTRLDLREAPVRSYIPEGPELRAATAARQGALIDARKRRGGIMSVFRWFNIFSSAFLQSLSGPRAELRPEPVAALDVMTWVHFDFGIPVFVRYSGFGVGIAYASMMVIDKDGKVRMRYLVNKLMPWGPNAREPFSTGAWAVPEIMVVRMAIAIEAVLVETDQVQYITNRGESIGTTFVKLRSNRGKAWNMARLGLVLQYPTALAAGLKTRLTVEPMDEEDVGMNDDERIARDSVRTPSNVRNTPAYAIMPAGSTTATVANSTIETDDGGNQRVVLQVDDDGNVTQDDDDGGNLSDAIDD